MLHVRFLTNAQHVFLLFLLNIFILYIFLLTLLLLFAASGAGPAYPVLSSPLSSLQPDLTEQQLPGDSADGPGQATQPAVPGQSGPNRFCGPVQPGGPAHPAGLQPAPGALHRQLGQHEEEAQRWGGRVQRPPVPSHPG